jgi:cell division protein FtsB
MESQGRSLWPIAAALIVGLVVAGAPAGYFYLQSSSSYSKNATLSAVNAALNSQITSLQTNETALRGQIAALQANITATVALKAKLSAKVTASAQEIQKLDSQISTLNQEVNTDYNTITYDTQQLNIYAAQLQTLQGIASHENLSAIQVIANTPLSWASSACTSACLTAAYFYGPYKVTDFAGYLNFTFTNPRPSDVQVKVQVTWDGYGVHYSDAQTITGTGTATFPVLLTNDLNFTVEPLGPPGNDSVHMTILWYD